MKGLESLPVPEPTLDARYTTAGSSPKANPSISLLQFWGSLFTRGRPPPALLASDQSILDRGVLAGIINWSVAYDFQKRFLTLKGVIKQAATV